MTERYSEMTQAMMAVNAVIGTCFAIRLLDLSPDERKSLVDLFTMIEKKTLVRTGATCGVLGQSARAISEETLRGVAMSADSQNLPRAIIGLASAAEILDGDIPWEVRYRLFQLCQSLLNIAANGYLFVPESARKLAEEVFTDMVDIQDSPEYRALEPVLQTNHGIVCCGDEYWNPAWDKVG